MLCISNNNLNPYFNIACEEYLFNEIQDDCFMLYRNDKSIIVGKHQNALAEMDYSYVKENNIQVIRRLTGGGAVYHDLGNLNFTFIKKNHDGNLVDYKKHLKPIIDILLKLGIPFEVGLKNDLIIEGKKFSGNAEHVYKNKMLHHGTILFSSDINKLSHALEVSHDKYKDKAVKSVRSKVVNIGEYIIPKIDVIQFAELLMNQIIENDSNNIRYQLSDFDKVNIYKLIENKYSCWEWNFAYSPAYRFYNRKTCQIGEIEISLEVDKGVIQQIRFLAENMKKDDRAKIEKALIGCNHEENVLRTKLENINVQNMINQIDIEELIHSMF